MTNLITTIRRRKRKKGGRTNAADIVNADEVPLIRELVQLILETTKSLQEENKKEEKAHHDKKRRVDKAESSDEDESSVEDGLLLKTNGYDRKTPLDVLCQNSCDPVLLKMMLDSVPEKAREKLFWRKEDLGSTLIYHVACQKCPFTSLKLIMSFFHETSSMDPTLYQGYSDETYLHGACNGNCSLRRLQQLMAHGAAGLKVRDRSRHYPLDCFLRDSHYRTQRNLSPQQRLERLPVHVDSMLRAFYNQRETSEDEWFLVHTLVQTPFCRPYVLRALLTLPTFGRDDMSRFDGHGMLPLHAAVARPMWHTRQEPLAVEEREESFGEFGDPWDPNPLPSLKEEKSLKYYPMMTPMVQ